MEEIVDKGKKGIAELSGDTKILVNVLEKILLKEKQGVASYKELSLAIQRDVQGGYRHLLNTARRHFEEANKVTTDVVMNNGIKLTNDYTGILSSTLSRVCKLARKSSKRVVRAMEYDGNITNEQLIATNTRLSALAPIIMMSKPSALKKIEAKVTVTSKELPTAETLRMFER